MNKNIEHIFKYMSVYMSASLDIHSSFVLVMKRARPGHLSEILKKIELDMKSGKPLHESFAHLKRSKYIDEVCWSLVSTAEQSGSISASFMRVSEYISQRLKMRSSLAGALMYPVGMLLVSLSMVYFLISVVFPKIIPLFSSMNVQLPLTARSIMVTSKAISEYGIYGLSLAAIVCAACAYLFARDENFRRISQQFYVSLPYIGKIAKTKEHHRISLILGLLMHNGKTLHEAVTISAGASSMLPFRAALRNIAESLQAGRSMAEGLEKYGLFPQDWIDLVTVGESTGTLPKTFSDLSAVYSEKYKDDIQTLVRVSEPAALACSALAVLVVALAVIQPMYSLIQHINN